MIWLFWLFFQMALAGDCDLQGLQSLCDSIKDSPEAFLALSSEEFLKNPNAQSTSVAWSEFQKQQARGRLQKNFLWVQQVMKKKILAGQTEDSLQGLQKIWFERINTLQLHVSDCQKGDGLGGKYFPLQHQVQICLQNGFTSGAQLIGLLAHEMSHSIDGCHGQLPLYHVKAHLPAPASGFKGSALMGYEAVANTQYFLPSFQTTVGDASALSAFFPEWTRRGLLQKRDDGVPAQDFPWTSYLQCLKSEGLIAPGAEVVRSGESCHDSVVSETPSDAWGALITGEYLKEHPPQSRRQKLAVLSDESIRLMCHQQTGPKAPAPLGAPFWQKSRASQRRYLSSRYRDEATLLADPQVQKALGCQPTTTGSRCRPHLQFPAAATQEPSLTAPSRQR